MLGGQPVINSETAAATSCAHIGGDPPAGRSRTPAKPATMQKEENTLRSRGSVNYPLSVNTVRIGRLDLCPGSWFKTTGERATA